MPLWKQFSGQWTVTQAAQARGAGTWPSLPGAPTIGTATAGVGEVSVAFTAPANPGYPTTLTYEVTSSPGSITASGSASPIVVTGLTNGTEYTFTVTATNDTGTGLASAASNAATPVAAGGAWGWGESQNGNQGLGYTLPTQSSPVQIGALTNWTQIEGYSVVSAAIKSDGTLWTWGRGNDGQLGHGDNVHRSSPVQVGSLTTWAMVRPLSSSMYALKTDGTMWAWGDNYFGNLGTNNRTNTNSPVQVGTDTDWAYIGYGGSEAGYAVKTNGTLWVWGHEDGGNLGFSDSTNRSSPTQLGSQTDWATINTKSTSLIATKTGGQLYAWGTNTTGQLGISNSISKSSPVQVGSLTNWQVGMAEDSSVCIKTDGTLWTWGSNDEGQLGHNLSPSERATASSPVQVGSLTTWENAVVSTGNFMFGVESGELYAWGRNSEGQLGLSSAGGTNRSSPTQVGSSTDWISAATGLYVGLAIGPES